MVHGKLLPSAVLAAVCCSGAAGAASVPAALCDYSLKGYEAGRLASCIANHVEAADALYLASPFRHKTETWQWQAEFWGKYMHSAAPFFMMTGSPRLRAAMDASAEIVRAAQEQDGYIGNYVPEERGRKNWDTWSVKYTLMGLMYHYEATGNEASLAAANRLGGYLVSKFGPGKADITKACGHFGLPALSLLEPVVRLYRHTKDGRYLDFAGYLVSRMEGGGEKDLKLVSAPLAGIDVRNRSAWAEPPAGSGKLNPGLKAYEMMSCYQGMLDYYQITGEGRLLEAAWKTADSIVRTELNIAGGCASVEHWYRGAENQVKRYRHTQETCVLTTWMRLCAKLLEITGEPRWADELEKTFCNAYLGALNAEGSFFASYTPLVGSRCKGQYHCRMHTNCCNANGPRGFLAWLDAFLRAEGNAVLLNFYCSGAAKIRLPESGETVELETFTLYPHMNSAEIFNRTGKPLEFTLKLRIPAWSERTSVAVCGEKREARAGEYLVLNRLWKPGDSVKIEFDFTGRVHCRGDSVAFTRGPVVLARDRRFGDGDFSETVRGRFQTGAPVDIRPARAPDAALRMAFAIELPMGAHDENPENRLPRTVGFCDYASAGNTWDMSSFYSVWLPAEIWLQAGF